MITTISNYGLRIQNPTSYVKNLKKTLINSNNSNDNNNNNKTQDLTSYVKSIVPSKNNGSFIKTFNNY
jgi:hypothetical protein